MSYRKLLSPLPQHQDYACTPLQTEFGWVCGSELGSPGIYNKHYKKLSHSPLFFWLFVRFSVLRQVLSMQPQLALNLQSGLAFQGLRLQACAMCLTGTCSFIIGVPIIFSRQSHRSIEKVWLSSFYEVVTITQPSGWLFSQDSDNTSCNQKRIHKWKQFGDYVMFYR